MLRVVITGVLCASAGFFAGAVWTKSKYEKIANEEIEAMRQYVKKKTGDEEFASKKAQVEKHKEDMKKFEEERIKYSTESGKEEKNTETQKPYIIPEEEFVVDDEDFRKVSLEYYPESELLYEETEVIPNVDETVGVDCLNLLHGTDNDVIYVRNEDYGIDYEIIKIAGTGPER